VSSVVFMRGVNVGGHKAFQPSRLAHEMAALRVASIGAAGTFIVHAGADEGTIRKAFQKHLPFEAQLMICPARALMDLVKLDPFGDEASRTADAQFISVLEHRPRRLPPLPFYEPAGREWQVQVTAIHGCFVATLQRRAARSRLYPNEVVEKRLGVAATTRGWATILRVLRALEAEPAGRAFEPAIKRRPR